MSTDSRTSSQSPLASGPTVASIDQSRWAGPKVGLGATSFDGITLSDGEGPGRTCPSSRWAWAAPARTRTWPCVLSAWPITTAAYEPLSGSTPIITAATTVAGPRRTMTSSRPPPASRAGLQVRPGPPAPGGGRCRGVLVVLQTGAGDYREIYGRQHAPDYSAALTGLLIRAGHEGSAQVDKTMQWLLSMRQDDGGWAIPARTLGLPLKVLLATREILGPGRSRPSSHLITGIVLRALAAHRDYRLLAATRRAGELLKSRFFRVLTTIGPTGLPYALPGEPASPAARWSGHPEWSIPRGRKVSSASGWPTIR